MKNSVWHHKLWKKKLSELPLDGDPNIAWYQMQSMLDKELPLTDLPKGRGLAKTIGSKIVSMFGYILPAAAIISGITYLAIKQPAVEKLSDKKHNPKNSLIKLSDTLMNIKKLKIDSTLQFQSKDTLPFVTGLNAHSDKIIISTSPIIIENDALQNSSSVNSAQNIKILPVIEHQLSVNLIKEGDKSPNAIYRTAIRNRAMAYDQVEDPQKAKAKRIKPVKKRNPKIRNEIHTPVYNYGFEAGINVHKSSQSVFLGATAAYAINKRLLINSGLRFSFSNAMNGHYTHPSYNLKDSASKENLTIIDQRNLTTADIRLGLEYKISNRVSIKGGPVIGFLLNQGGTGSKLGIVKNLLDTIYNSEEINTALSNSTIKNKFNLGFSGGLSIRVKQFKIEAGYRQNFLPYKVSSELGSYKKGFKTFEIGIGYNFK